MCCYGKCLLACSQTHYLIMPFHLTQSDGCIKREGSAFYSSTYSFLSLSLSQKVRLMQSENNAQSHNSVCFLLLCGIQILRCLSWNSSALMDVVIRGYWGFWSLSVGFDIVPIPEVHSKQCVQSWLYNNTPCNEKEERLICMVTHPHKLPFFKPLFRFSEVECSFQGMPCSTLTQLHTLTTGNCPVQRG